MRKKFLALMTTLLCGAQLFALDSSGAFQNVNIKQFVETLDGIQGYFFIGKNESRALSLTLEREPGNDFNDASQVKAMHWSSLNPWVADVDDDGNISGMHYGETIITSDNNGEKTNYVVLVCPKITIVSPEGAIYSYHKIYNQKPHIQFTESKDFTVNCVLRHNSDGSVIDITDNIDENGWYNGEYVEIKDIDDQISEDVVLWVTMEGKNPAPNAPNVKITVDGQDVTIHSDDKSIFNKNIVVTNIRKDVLYNSPWPAGGTLTFKPENKGVFFIEIPGVNTYKIIIYDIESQS